MSGKTAVCLSLPLAVRPRLGDKFCARQKLRPMTALEQPFRLRDRLVTPARNSILGPEGETGIEPKIMAVLCVLAGDPGRVFTRAELIDQVWGTEFGTDESLTRAISHLRKALGDTRGEPLVIETIARRGYRLLPEALSSGEVSISPQTPVPAPPSGRRFWLAGMGAAALAAGALVWFRPFSRAPASAISVTVLPVNPVRREPSQASLATALTVDLVGALAKEKRLHVTVKRPDPNLPKGGRRYSIYADLQTAEGQVKAHVEIMDVDTDQALWSRLYERPFDNTLSSQDQLAQSIAQDLTGALLTLAKQ